MLFVLYVVLFFGGIVTMGWASTVTGFEGVVFVGGILLVSAALAAPITASAIDHRGG